MIYHLERREIIAASLDDVFAFFKNPLNLEAMTPPWLGFKILHATDAVVKVGTRIQYQLRLHGIPLRWESRITEFVEGREFADEQLSGPYRSWYHRHTFRTVDGGVEMTDSVAYSLPFGILGRIAHVVAVRRQLRKIFDYRTRMVVARFASAKATSEIPARSAA